MLDSDERIQGNPSLSNPHNQGFGGQTARAQENPNRVDRAEPRGRRGEELNPLHHEFGRIDLLVQCAIRGRLRNEGLVGGIAGGQISVHTDCRTELFPGREIGVERVQVIERVLDNDVRIRVITTRASDRRSSRRGLKPTSVTGLRARHDRFARRGRQEAA
jgi:hypothetical protein